MPNTVGGVCIGRKILAVGCLVTTDEMTTGSLAALFSVFASLILTGLVETSKDKYTNKANDV